MNGSSSKVLKSFPVDYLYLLIANWFNTAKPNLKNNVAHLTFGICKVMVNNAEIELASHKIWGNFLDSW